MLVPVELLVCAKQPKAIVRAVPLARQDEALLYGRLHPHSRATCGASDATTTAASTVFVPAASAPQSLLMVFLLWSESQPSGILGVLQLFVPDSRLHHHRKRTLSLSICCLTRQSSSLPVAHTSLAALLLFESR